MQYQNLYLLNYIHKLEFLIQESVKERKSDKKKREVQMESVLETLSECKPALISKDIKTLKYCK